MLHGAKRRRCVVLADGSAIGSYQRNSHETHTVVIEPSGHTYSYIQPDGTRTRHLTPTALSSHRPLVLDTLNLRNKFTDHAPYVHLRLMDSKNVRRLRRICAPRARWPRSEGNTKVSRLFNDQDKCFEMQSIEGAAKVRLHTSGKLIKVYYVVEVKVSDDDMEECSHAHYATLCRSFPARQTPEDFAFPVGVLLAAKSAWDKDREAEIEYNGESDDSPVVSQLPRNGAFAARPAFSVIATSNDGVQVDGDSESCLPLAEILRIATLPSKLLYQRVVAEVVGDDTTVFVQLDNEGFLLTGCDGFFTWYDETGRLQHRFTRETIPPSTTIETKSSSSSVASLCQHIDYLGRFRAYRGGRIRVAFADRTILQVERNGESCSFFFPDGSTGQTTLASAPLRHRTYIYQALEFGDWAFASQEERMQRHEKRQEAQAIVARELRRINVRCGMNSELEVYNKLQAATLAHIVSVDHALQAAASMATKDT
ncbi:uncharacterized protein PITG_06130 [Phytophthora infestans T30-4]|uniref:C5orf34-like C-terminal domain-containing protein n=1 Tax=Phytophthora infestans (strain T30-4) TaxID=403677 RepID=D0N6G5_PHYIT|nr:uncharacterized protein PITG_06130 [Phytophthora infestans T30-4]EEY70656.1 conserved hypothetical protein [Phytophthora infestans T30-4]|eukprot:XP_002998310.1 conserved hypothetical protein [Phytophthora infestans T30-4]